MKLSRPRLRLSHPLRQCIRVGTLLAGTFVFLELTPTLLGAQTTPAAANPQMRDFWHVFAAYAIAWTLIFGWLVSILGRIKKVEKQLGL